MLSITEGGQGMRKGDTLIFGKYKMRVLDIQENKALVITEEILFQRPFHNKKGDVTWAHSEIRHYLNNEFYHSFDREVKENILLTTLSNDNNQWYDSDGGDVTQDYIFLLSVEEVVCKFFGDSSSLLYNRSLKQRYWFQRKDINNHLREAYLFNSGWWWWLRTPGRDNKRAVYIHGDGNIGIQGNSTYRYSSNTIHKVTNDNSGGIRPAMWIKV